MTIISTSERPSFFIEQTANPIIFQGALIAVDEITINGNLDIKGFTSVISSPGDWIKASHIIIKEIEGDTIKPMPLNESNTGYASIPDGYQNFGIQLQDVPKTRPLGIVVTKGSFKTSLSPYPLTEEIINGLPNISFS